MQNKAFANFQKVYISSARSILGVVYEAFLPYYTVGLEVLEQKEE